MLTVELRASEKSNAFGSSDYKTRQVKGEKTFYHFFVWIWGMYSDEQIGSEFLKGLLSFKNMHTDLQVPEIPQAVAWHSPLCRMQRAFPKLPRHRFLPEHLQAGHRHSPRLVSLSRVVLLMKCILPLIFVLLSFRYSTL